MPQLFNNQTTNADSPLTRASGEQQIIRIGGTHDGEVIQIMTPANDPTEEPNLVALDAAFTNGVNPDGLAVVQLFLPAGTPYFARLTGAGAGTSVTVTASD